MGSLKKLFNIKPDGFIDKVKQIYSPNQDERPHNIKVTMIVIHNISLPPNKFGGNNIEKFFSNKLNINEDPYFATIKNNKVSSHFLIKRNGGLVQFVSCHKRAWHAGESIWGDKRNCNDFSIGIELEGSDFIKFDSIQYTKLINLIKCLYKNYPITEILGHNQISPKRKTDPGPFFDWSLIRSEKFDGK